MNTQNLVHNQFTPVAAEYAASAVHAFGPDLLALVQAAALTGTEQVLDVGCGSGHTALALAPYAAQVTAFDLAEAMLAQVQRLAAERGLTNVAVQQGDVGALPFADSTFDRVSSRYSAHHYPDPAAALRQIARVLKPDGTLLLADVVAPDDPTADTFLNTIELLRDRSHVRDHTVRQWVALCAEAGLQAELLGIWPIRLEFTAWVARMRTPPDAVAQIRVLFDGAPAGVRAALAVEADHSFSVPVALLRAQPRVPSSPHKSAG